MERSAGPDQRIIDAAAERGEGRDIPGVMGGQGSRHRDANRNV
jgi:hypothetical protein